MTWRAVTAAVGGFALGFAYRDQLQRAHERRQMNELERALDEGIGHALNGFADATFPDEFGEFE